MKKGRFFFAVFGCNAFLSLGVFALLTAFRYEDDALPGGFIYGLCIAALALFLFYKAWRAAPNGPRVALWYALRLAAVFGGVALALFVPGVSALGAVIPQILQTPVLAVLFALGKH